MEGDQSLGDLLGAAGEDHASGRGIDVEGVARPSAAKLASVLEGVVGERLVLVAVEPVPGVGRVPGHESV